jgi:hypothetical protein
MTFATNTFSYRTRAEAGIGVGRVASESLGGTGAWMLLMLVREVVVELRMEERSDVVKDVRVDGVREGTRGGGGGAGRRTEDEEEAEVGRD